MWWYLFLKPKTCLESYQTSSKEHLSENSKKISSQMFDWVLNMPLNKLKLMDQICKEIRGSKDIMLSLWSSPEVNVLTDWIHSTILLENQQKIDKILICSSSLKFSLISKVSIYRFNYFRFINCPWSFSHYGFIYFPRFINNIIRMR